MKSIGIVVVVQGLQGYVGIMETNMETTILGYTVSVLIIMNRVLSNAYEMETLHDVCQKSMGPRFWRSQSLYG